MNNNQDFNLDFPIFSVVDEMKKHIQELTKPIEEMISKINSIVNPIFETIEKNNAKWVEIAKKISEAGKTFVAIGKLGDAQFVYWGFMTIKFRDELCDSQNINKTLRVHLEKNKYQIVKETIAKTRYNPYMKKYSRLYNQSVEAFWQGLNDLCVTGLTAVFDGLLSDISKNPSTKLQSRINIIISKLENDEALENDEYATLSLAMTFENTMETFCKDYYNFTQKEPKELSRHWIAHGRSHRRKTRLDCVKMINIIYGLLLIDELRSTLKSDNDIQP